jgi:hypothetical protein
MVKMGETARGKTFPHPPSAFHLPAPPPPAVAQLTSSWGKGAPRLVAPPEAQGVQGARPRRYPATPFLAALGSVVAQLQPHPAGGKKAASAGS